MSENTNPNLGSRGGWPHCIAEAQTPPADKPLSKKETLDGLKYIADSPSRDFGGFNAYAVQIARSAVFWMRKK